jgi:hypothetical protein
MATFRPLLFKRQPSDAAVIPLPSEETTPPVIKTNLAMLKTPPLLHAFITCVQGLVYLEDAFRCIRLSELL